MLMYANRLQALAEVLACLAEDEKRTTHNGGAGQQAVTSEQLSFEEAASPGDSKARNDISPGPVEGAELQPEVNAAATGMQSLHKDGDPMVDSVRKVEPALPENTNCSSSSLPQSVKKTPVKNSTKNKTDNAPKPPLEQEPPPCNPASQVEQSISSTAPGAGDEPSTNKSQTDLKTRQQAGDKSRREAASETGTESRSASEVKTGDISSQTLTLNHDAAI